MYVCIRVYIYINKNTYIIIGCGEPYKLQFTGASHALVPVSLHSLCYTRLVACVEHSLQFNEIFHSDLASV